MLFNFETAKEKREARAFLEMMPEAKLLPYGVSKGYEDGTVEVDKKHASLWIPESLYLPAWTYFSQKSLKIGDVTFRDGMDYFHLQRNDPHYVKDEIKEEVLS